MRSILVIFLFFSLSVRSEEYCPDSNTSFHEVDQFAGDIIAVVARTYEEDDSVESVESAARLFLRQYPYQRLDFEVSTAENLLKRLKVFTDSENGGPEVKSRLWLLVSGLHGKIAEKLRMSGAAHGKEAYRSLKKSLAYDKTNKEAASSYARAVAGIAEQNFVFRHFIVKGLGVKLSTEALSASEALENAGLKGSPVYDQMITLSKK